MSLAMSTSAMSPEDFAPNTRPPPRTASDRAYRAAVRHTRLVRFLRKAIPVGAVLSFIGFIVFPFINPFRAEGVSVGAIRMDGTRVTMEAPRLTGHRQGNQPYEVTAVSAVQDIRRPNVIEMNQMTARLTQGDNSQVVVTSVKAVFDTQREQMQLREGVTVRTQSGQEAQLVSADADFKAGTLVSREQVAVRFPDMSVSAAGLEITGNGAEIAFIGRVQALIDDKDSKADSVQGPAPGAAGNAPAGTTTRAAAPVPVQATPAQVTPAPAASPPAAMPRDMRGVVVIDPATGRVVAPRANP
jgi:lipopolysaccharide export system protein LptC